MGPESRLQRQVLQYLRGRPSSWTFKVKGGPGQTPGVPDLCHVERGVTLWIELKAPSGCVTLLQDATHRMMRLAGAQVVVCRTLDEVRTCVEGTR